MEGPFLERGAPAVGGQRDDPEVAVDVFRRSRVHDFAAGDRRVALGRDDLALQRERLVGSIAFGLPESGDGGRSGDRWVERPGPVGRVGGEQSLQ
jgi:hypothetical protein